MNDAIQKAKVWLMSMGFDPDDDRNVEQLAAVFRHLAEQTPISPLPSTDA